MSIRQNRAAEDIQTLIYTFLNSLKSAQPWSRWEIIRGYPRTENFELQDLFIFVMLPKYIPSATVRHQGGNIDLGGWVCRIGVWDSRLSGGTQEIGIASSQLLYVFRNTEVWAKTTFNVTFATAYTGTTILNQGVSVNEIDGPFEIIKNTETNEFRFEFDLYLRG